MKRYVVAVRIAEYAQGVSWWSSQFATNERGAAIARAYEYLKAGSTVRVIDRHTETDVEL